MFDDHQPPEDYTLDDHDGEDSYGSSRWRNCLFIAITLLLVIVLTGSSILTYFVVSSRASSQISPQVTALEPTIEATQVAGLVEPALVENTPVSPNDSRLQGSENPADVIDRIVIVNSEGQVETISPDGDDRRTLTNITDNRFYIFPAWSPDSQRVAVIGSGRTGSGIYILEDVTPTATSDTQPLYFSPTKSPIYLYWSPDSAHLAFLANESRSGIGLNIVSSDGQASSRLVATGSPFYWDWAGNGRQLLIHSGQRNAGDKLALIDLEGIAQADNLALPGSFQAPGIAPDDRYFAFAEEVDDAYSTLAVIDTATGERQQFEQAGSIALSWSPTQPQIAFTSGSVDTHPLWGPLVLLNVPSGETRLLSLNTVIAFFWSPDGRSIAFITLSNNRDDDDIQAGAIEKANHLSRVGLPVQQMEQAFLTLSVVDVATGQGLRLLDFVPTPAFISQFLPYFDQYALSHQLWSPDSSNIVLPVREEGSNVILVIPTVGGRPYRLAEGEVAFWSQR